MSLGDLLGLLFLIFFVILPALQGFLRRSQDLPQDFEPDQIPLPGQKTPPAKGQPQPPTPQRGNPAAKPAASPATPQPPVAPPPAAPRPLVSEPAKPKPKKAGKALEELERERLARKTQPQPPAQPRPTAPPAPVPSESKPIFSTDPRAILNGMVWAQVLNEPRGKYWRRTRKPKL
ncbi:hypothetical protein [Meiothermus granaticius]|uniref:hypothetical protein n=1 Tax=Meiothermus granaticius TaxID=863370 RepID=UPI000E65B745|nr:hypothetical protein [Meiothermus granaticius]GEM86105.1 hypothetical protein MGR01S_07300 [Meiothermus granaticius NBRC 107808]